MRRRNASGSPTTPARFRIHSLSLASKYVYGPHSTRLRDHGLRLMNLFFELGCLNHGQLLSLPHSIADIGQPLLGPNRDRPTFNSPFSGTPMGSTSS